MGGSFTSRGYSRTLRGEPIPVCGTKTVSRLDDAILHAIVFKQDEPSEDESSVYEVFQRLNTGRKEADTTGRFVRYCCSSFWAD